MKPIFLPSLLSLPYFLLSVVLADHGGSLTIIFTTLGRADYDFDIYTLPNPFLQPSTNIPNELRITDGLSVNFNGHFTSPFLLSLLPNQSQIQHPLLTHPPSLQLVYVTERGGVSSLYYDAVYLDSSRITSTLEFPIQSVTDRIQIPLLASQDRVSMKDKPTLTGDHLVYVSTHQDTGIPRTSWAAVYSTHLKSGFTRRLTPQGVADFSPTVSPSGMWTAVASYNHEGWDGEVEDLSTDIYVFMTRDGSRRVKIVEHGGWPSWVDDSTLYFHRRGDDQWWSIYRAVLPSQGQISTETVVVERVTPPGLHSFTPATSPGNNKFIALATRRPTSSFRHVELFDLATGEFKELTRLISPQSNHFNPFLSPDSSRVGYHKCSGGRSSSTQLLMENVKSPVPELSLFRFDGSFPSFSPTGDRIAYVNLPGVYVINPDGSNRRKVYNGMAFPTAWDPVRRGIIYSSTGPTFASESTEVDVIAIDVDDFEQKGVKKLTTNGKNNAFPSPSPDGKWIVFRSGRSGHKNLYIMDAVEGEKGGLRRLTEGPWTDTMCNWSPDGSWIAFSSDRHNPRSGSYELYLIHPNGTGLRKLVQSGSGGRANHPVFSQDGKRIAFTSDYAGISAEPISNPHHYQPYGEIFWIRLDGSGLERLTHNSYEDGTPAWSPKYVRPLNVEWVKDEYCAFQDCHWLNVMPNQSLAKIKCGA